MQTSLLQLSVIENTLPKHLGQWASQLAAAQACLGVDPFLIAAIMDRESRGGLLLKPRGPAGVGDGGRGHGLMQIDSHYHESFLRAFGPDGKLLWQDPLFNILFGAALYRGNLTLFQNDEPMAIGAYNASAKRVRDSVASPLTAPMGPAARIAAIDRVTTGGNYVSDVLRRRKEFLSKVVV